MWLSGDSVKKPVVDSLGKEFPDFVKEGDTLTVDEDGCKLSEYL